MIGWLVLKIAVAVLVIYIGRKIIREILSVKNGTSAKAKYDLSSQKGQIGTSDTLFSSLCKTIKRCKP